ncbi:hypothetical protein BDN72DRAFT_907260 [Pluteus cervinus]|uniref:Uncharacterized protein n=1 Tax=Pluteus cervinus TaxID=181527 RepID=A0ACD2ZZ86_9AGAR|nr:hypothetical protein BDN72DRAFT_907260 [Pluteus cervinus]
MSSAKSDSRRPSSTMESAPKAATTNRTPSHYSTPSPVKILHLKPSTLPQFDPLFYSNGGLNGATGSPNFVSSFFVDPATSPASATSTPPRMPPSPFPLPSPFRYETSSNKI